MADEVLFDFLHMEMVSHVYKEQRSSKGELDSKVMVNRLTTVNVTLFVLSYTTLLCPVSFPHHRSV